MGFSVQEHIGFSLYEEWYGNGIICTGTEIMGFTVRMENGVLSGNLM